MSFENMPNNPPNMRVAFRSLPAVHACACRAVALLPARVFRQRRGADAYMTEFAALQREIGPTR
ncbi:MAG: hypothetical protein RQ752_16610, partial [Thermohalobaculum sp.]|nr:hypothetical protein [Thermohalobaculum sp.]